MADFIEPLITIYGRRRTQILVTGFAVLIFLMGFKIPLPIQPTATTNFILQGKPYSIFALGLFPWIFSASFAEVLVLISPRVRKTILASHGHADPYCGPVIIFAVIISVLYGIIFTQSLMALMQTDGESNFLLFVVNVLSLAGGTAVIIALGQWIKRIGLGMGFWVLIAAGNIFEVASDFAQMPNILANRIIDYQNLALNCIFNLLGVAIAVSLLLLRQKNGKASIAQLLWPLFVAGILSLAITNVLQLVPPAWTNFISQHFVFYFVFEKLLMVVFVFIYARGDNPPMMRWLTVLAIGSILFLDIPYLILPVPRLILGAFPLIFLSYACIVLFSEFAEAKRMSKLKVMHRPLRHFRNT